MWISYEPSEKQLKHLRDRLSRYGLTLEQFIALSEGQGHVCAICGERCSKFPRLSVDHRHSDGAIRGLLCDACNIGLGHFRDNPESLRAAIEYLEREYEWPVHPRFGGERPP